MKRGSALANVEILKSCGTSILGRVYDFCAGERWLVTEALADRLVITGHARRLTARKRRIASDQPGDTSYERIPGPHRAD